MKPILFSLLAAACFAAEYDLIFRNARVVDGTGNPWFRADVGVKGGKIGAIGNLKLVTATRVIDAQERILAPGFIDVHTHIEGAVEKVPRADNYLTDGVTTVVTGNCGGSNVMVADWLKKIQNLGLGINVATLIGHNSIRREVMGSDNRQATAEELLKMQAMVARAMEEGAVGFSTGLIYIPGTYSNTAEVVALAKAASKYGGVYASHMRDEGEKIEDAINEAVLVGKESGLRVELSHFKIDNRNLWGASTKSLALVEKFRREGVDVVIDQYPYDHSSTNLGITLPSWALAGGDKSLKERLDAAESKARIVAEMKTNLKEKGHADYTYATVANYGANHDWDGKNIVEITKLKQLENTVDNQVETILGIMRSGGAQMVYHSMGDEDVDRIMRYPFTAIASDGGVREFGVGVPHPRSYGTNARVLAEYVRKRNILTLEDAIRRMTSLPARTFGFKDRGMIREGMAADLLLFDPAKVQDKATYPEPHQYSEGFDYVVVNGQLMIDGSKLTNAKAGLALKR